MLNKHVCPKCGQLFDASMDKCPLCGLPVQPQPAADTPVQRRRITEAERRQRQQAQRRATSEERRRERDERRAADAEAERKLEEEEERRRQARRRSRLERQGYTAEEAERLLSGEDAPSKRQRAQQTGGIPKNMLILSIVLSCAAILIGACYLIWRANGGVQKASAATGECSAITLNTDAVEFASAGQTFTLSYQISPADCKQPVSFQSSDTTVADVGATGIVTAKQPGTAKITARCGAQEASCTVTCSFSETPAETELVLPDGLALSKTDITFFNPNESIYLHVENVPNGTIIDWKSDDMTVAVVEQNGHVIAVSEGTCKVIATVGEYTAECIVRCNFD